MNKWTAQELLDSLNKETNQNEMHELWKAIIAYELGATEIDNKVLDKVLEKWYNDNTKTSIIDNDILEWCQELFDKEIVENYFNDKN